MQNIDILDIYKIFDDFLDKENAYNKVLGYFINRLGDEFISEDLAGKVLAKLFLAIKSGKYSPTNGLLFTIAKQKYIDYCKKKKLPYLSNEDKIRNKDGEIKVEDQLKYEDDIMERIIKKETELKIYQLRRVLLSENRSLQEAPILCLAPSMPKLREKIGKKFDFIVKRYRKRKLGYSIIQKSEIKNADKINDESGDFNDFLFSAVKKLGMDDDMGRKALAVLFLSSYPLPDWFHLSLAPKIKYDLSLNKEGVYKKKTISRPYPSLFRDYVAFICGLEGLEEILGNEKAKLKVTDKYIKKLYKIGSLSANTINKQINGRTDSLGLKDRVNNYEKVVKEIIEEL